MPIRQLFHSPRARRGIALGAVVLSLGGLVLVQAPVDAHTDPIGIKYGDEAPKNASYFSGAGVRGRLALSHGHVMAGSEQGQRLFAELLVRADEADVARERAPLSMVVVLDTSGSMDGEKLSEAKRSVERLLSNMRDDDQVALVRYDSKAQIVQLMAPVGEVRHSLTRRIAALHADGGTNIPAALRLGLRVLRDTPDSRVKRMVLVSDGLDHTRDDAVRLAKGGLSAGATISALGIGLDFDESYMAAVSRAGHGNFAYVDKASSLSRFLQKELNETASTTARKLRATIQLPRGMRLVRTIGAEAVSTELGVELTLGNLFSGDERRVVLELEANTRAIDAFALGGSVSWSTLSGEAVARPLDGLVVHAARDQDRVARSRDQQVYASCLSALASQRQLEAAAAYRRGERDVSSALIEENLRELRQAEGELPASLGAGLRKQADGYETTKGVFDSAAPGSDSGSAAAKRVWAKEDQNTKRKLY